MEENPLLAAFAKLVADFLNVPENDPDLLKSVLEQCAQAILQGQDPGGMRDTFEFERIRHFTTQYLKAEDRQYLSDLFDSVAMTMPFAIPEFQLFFREMPNRATWLRSSIPNWAFSAELVKTMGSLVNRDGRRFWIDVYRILPVGWKEVRMVGANRPVFYLGPDAGLTLRVVSLTFNIPMTEVKMAAGTIWIQARLFTPLADEDLYCGLRVEEVTIVSPRMLLPDLWITQHPFSPVIKTGVRIHLAKPPVPDPLETPFGADARAASVNLPESLTLRLSPNFFSLDEIGGSVDWQVYGDSRTFRWTQQQPTYNSLFNAVSFPFDPGAEDLLITDIRSPLISPTGQAPIVSASWLLPAARLKKPLRAAGCGMLLAELKTGLNITSNSWLDADQINPARLELGDTFLTVAPDLLQLMAMQAASEYVIQNYHLWVGAGGRWNQLQIHFSGKFPFLYQSDASGFESYAAIGDCRGDIDQPVSVDGTAFALNTKQSLLVRTHTDTQDDLVLFDENILRDNLPTSPDGAAPSFQGKAIALNNALLTVSPLNGFLLSGRLAPLWNSFESAGLSYGFGLLGYLPTLPDPYAANTGVFRWMTEQLGGRKGFYTLDRIKRYLVATMRWQSYDAPPVHFIFGDREVADPNQPVRLNLLDNRSLADENTYAQFKTRAQKARDRIQRRTDKNIQSDLYEYDTNIHLNDSYRHHQFFSLLDVSTAADWMGVNVGHMDERLFFERTFEVRTDQNALSAEGMDVVATGRFVRLFTVPQVSWEPVTNLTKPFNPDYDPPAGLLLFKDDGPPTLMGNTGADTVPIAPLPLAAYLEKNYRENNDFKAWSFFSLPFGMVGIARYVQEVMATATPPGATIELIEESFAEGVKTSLQISTKGYLHLQGNRNFEGTTRQLFNLYGSNGDYLNRSILSQRVTEIFNNEFGPDGSTYQLRQRGVPVERYDFSGYGANLFSHWLNPQAKIGETSQAKFDVWRGRTAHEVIQVRSIIYPWGIRVVRTITMFRESTGLVYRIDSGWRADSDGVYDFKTEVITGKDAQGNNIVKLETAGYSFHCGIVKGVFAVRNIVETSDVSPYTNSWFKTTGYYINSSTGVPEPVGAGQSLDVQLIPVYFDADVQLENVIQGGNNNRLPAQRMLGFIQISPRGIPISAEDFAALLKENQGLGGPVDGLIDIAASGQHMRVNRVEVQPSQEAGKIVFVAAAKGTPVLPKDGSWSLVMHKKASDEVLPIGNSGVPLIRRGLHNMAINAPLELTDPVELFNTNPEDRATQFGFLQNTDTQKVLFRNPFFAAGQKLLQSSKPDLADAYRLLDSKGIFPKLKGLQRIDLQDFNLNIIDQGYQLLHKIDPAQLLQQDLNVGPTYFINEKDVKIYVEYEKKDIKGIQLGPGSLNFNIDSVARQWTNKLNDITMVIDLLKMKRLFLIRGKFDTEKGKVPSFTGPELEFGEDLQPVYDILQILLLLNGGEYKDALTKGLKIAMSNSPNNWEYKFQADKEIPALRFPPPLADSPVAPLRLECYLKLGCYFNVGLPSAPTGGLPVPSGGGYVEFGARLSVMCVSLAAATVYAIGTCVLRIGADTVSGPNFYLKAGFGVELMVGLPVIGSVSVYYGCGIEIYIDTGEIIAGGFITFRGRAELIGGLVTIQIQIEAAGKIAQRAGDRTDMVAQVTFSLDISIFLVINISFSKTFEERRQIA
jgi:hypothetical protein